MYKSNQINIFILVYADFHSRFFCYFDDDDFTLIAVLKVINIISKRSLCHSIGSTNLKLIFPKIVLNHALNNQTYSSYVVALSSPFFFHAEANRL